MNGLEESLKIVAEKLKAQANLLATEEAVKTAIVLPVLRALGYDIFNPSEVIPEFTADTVGKKGEKVDYAISLENDVQILIECKPISFKLEAKHAGQLFRYFSVTKAKFGILTNGRQFNFYTDLEEKNKMDMKPFFTFDLMELKNSDLIEIKKFEKNSFDIPNILLTAERLKYTSGIKQAIENLMENPTEDFVRLISANVYEGRLTAANREMLQGVTKTAFRELISEIVKLRISSALVDPSLPIPDEEKVSAETNDEIEPTEEEIQGYMIIKAILREEISPARIAIRDAKSYCAILLDDNNRKPIARLHLNRSKKYIGLFDGAEEEKMLIESLDDIYQYSERLMSSIKKYTESIPA
ncbi:type I restriction endonuclease [Microvirga sp. W0021]|uniref:Type I restriction endonuclease n=1 Tax=Hohaiivirga grylli TaxID=3133970 RepID=A0ABV0BHK2_9HYPH